MGDPYLRVQYFPKAVENARAKLKRLEAEAREMRMMDVLTQLEAVNRAWDMEIERARIESEYANDIHLLRQSYPDPVEID